MTNFSVIIQQPMSHQIQMSAQPQMAQILTANGQLQQVQISSHQLTQQAPTNANQTSAEAGGSSAQQTQVQQAQQQLQPQQITLSGANGQQITVIPASSLANLQAAQQIRQQSNIIQVRNLVFIVDFCTYLGDS
jgi:uncharacterized protein YcbX